MSMRMNVAPLKLSPGVDDGDGSLISEIRAMRLDLQHLTRALGFQTRGRYPWAPGLDSFIEVAREGQTQLYDLIALDAVTARTNEEIAIAGDSFRVLSVTSGSDFSIRLNEKNNASFRASDILEHSGPFYRLFVSNPAGNGELRLIIGRGVSFTPREHGIEELAARLGSPVTFDRRGDVVWYDGFEDGIGKWETNTVGLGGSVAVSSAQARNGANSILLTAGSDNLRNASIFKYHPMDVLGRHGLEFSVDLRSAFENLSTTFQWNTGGTLIDTRIRYNDDTQSIAYYDADGNFQSIIDNFSLDDENNFFHTFKLVVDLTTQRYVRFIVDNVEHDLSSIPVRVIALGSQSQKFVNFVLTGRPSQNDAVAIDDVIITRNEP